jgi:hypothetical protein
MGFKPGRGAGQHVAATQERPFTLFPEENSISSSNTTESKFPKIALEDKLNKLRSALNEEEDF